MVGYVAEFNYLTTLLFSHLSSFLLVSIFQMRFTRALLSCFRVSLASLESRPGGIAFGGKIGKQVEKLLFVEAVDQ